MSKNDLKGEESKSANPGHPNQFTIQVRYQEKTVDVTVNAHESIMALLEAAIHGTDNESIPKERFQLKLGGTVLDLHKKVDDYPIGKGTLLVLVLSAGGGGNY